MMAGIMAAKQWGLTTGTAIVVLASVACASGGMLLLRRSISTAMVVMSLLVSASVGATLFSARTEYDWTKYFSNGNPMEVYITDAPQPTQRSLRANAEVAKLPGFTHASGKITLYFQPDSAAYCLRCGDRLVMRPHIYADRRSAYVPQNSFIVLSRDSTSLRATSGRIRTALIERMEQGPLPRGKLALAEALALGWRGSLDTNVVQSFRDCGLAHLLAVSGLHVGLVAALVGGMLFWVGRQRRGRHFKAVAQTSAVWAFALLTGMSASTVRASLMFSLMALSDITARHTPKMNVLALAALITLTINPTVLFDVGWQLSYCAVGGLLLARPVITAFRNPLWESATTSLAATVATLPVSLAVFHRLPLFFLPSNIILLPLTAPMLAFSLLYVALPCRAVGWCVGLLDTVLRRVSAFFAALPGAVVEFDNLGALQLATVSLLAIALLTAPQFVEVLARRRREERLPGV